MHVEDFRSVVYNEGDLICSSFIKRVYRAGQYSIRINDQWRICFKWDDGRAKEVEIIDYHS